MLPRIRSMLRPILPLAVVACAALSCKSDNPARPPEPAPQVRSEADLVAALARAYDTRDTPGFAALLHPDYVFRGTSDLVWCRDAEVCTKRPSFEPQSLGPADLPRPTDLQLVGIDVRLSSRGEFTAAPQYYRSGFFPSGLDRDLWRVTAAAYDATVEYRTRGGAIYRGTGVEVFYVANDLGRAVGDPAKFLLYRWSEPELYSASTAAPPK